MVLRFTSGVVEEVKLMPLHYGGRTGFNCNVMFIRVKKSGPREYLQIVESKRCGDKIRQRVIANLGRVDKLKESGEIDNLIEKLARFSERIKVIREPE